MAVGPTITDNPILTDPWTTEGADGIILEPTVTVTDPDGGINYATVTITDKAQPGDLLEYEQPPGSRIAEIESEASILLYVEEGGTATASEMTNALRLVTYRHTGDTPQSPKKYTFFVTDGQSDSFERTITVAPVNDAPTVDLHANGAATHLEQTGPTEVAPELTISDPESNTVAEATVELGNAQTGDVLAAPGGTFADGTLTIDFPDTTTIAQAQEVLRDVTFVAGGGDKPSTATRTATFTVQDQPGAASTGKSRNISVQAVNDAPSITGDPGWKNAGAAPSTVQEQADPGVQLSQTVGLTDPDAGIEKSVVEIVNPQPEDRLTYTAPNPVLSTAVVTAEDTGHKLTITGDNADVAGTLRTIRFRHIGDNPSTDVRDIKLTVTDVGGLTASQIHKAQVTPVNDSPSITGVPSATEYTEDDAPKAILPAVDIYEPEGGLAEVVLTVLANGTSADVFDVKTAPAGILVEEASDHVKLTKKVGESPSVADFRAALRSITYQDSRGSYTDDRDIAVSIKAKDGGDYGSQAFTIIRNRDRNDPPAVAFSQGNTTFTEDGNPVAVDSALTVSDEDTPSNLTGATVSIENRGPQDCLAYTGSHANVTVQNCTVTFSYSDTAANYQVELRKVVFTSGDQVGGVTRQVSFALTGQQPKSKGVTIAGVNDAPTVAAEAGEVAYSEGGTPATPGAELVVTDADSAQLTGATAVISGGRKEGDVLALGSGAPAGITGAYAADTGTLTLSGDASVADYQAALRSVRFSSTSESPGSGARTVAFSASDASGAGEPATRQVTVTPVADAPVVTTTAGARGWTKPNGPTAVDPQVSISDVDSTQLTSATVAIVGGLAAGDVLALPGTFDGITASYDSGTGKLTLSGTASLAKYRDALRAVTYDSSVGAPAAGRRTVRFTADDGEASGSAERNLEVAVTDPPAPPAATALIIDIGSAAAPVLRVDAGQVSVPCRPDKGTIAACAIALQATDGTTLAAQVLRGSETTVLLNAEGQRRLAASPLGLPITITAATTVAGKTIQATRAAVLFGTGKLTLKRLFRSSRSAKLTSSARKRLAAIAASGATLTSVRCSAATPKGAALARKRARVVCAALRSGGAQAGEFKASGKRSRTDAVRITAVLL